MFILDTNILIYLIRENTHIKKELSKLNVFPQQNAVSISIASVGEALSFALQNNWGDVKRKMVENLIVNLKPIPIVSRQLLDAYAEIDTYSKSKLSIKPLPIGQTARKMGKNDLWIAATTYLSKATLITTDNDFNHLNGIYFPVIKVSPTI